MKQERLYQDDNFRFTGFDGLKLERIVACEDPKTKNVIIVYIKVENNNWHRFFIDMGFGVWENWGELDITDESYNFIDYADNFGLVNQIILKISCQPDNNNCRIIIKFSSGEKLILRTKDVETFGNDFYSLVVEQR
jgi:hypothetical protein